MKSYYQEYFGLAMARINLTSENNYDSRQFSITVTGLSHQYIKHRNIKHRSIYTLLVPYNRLSQTIQQIHLLGDKIIDITAYSSPLFVPEIDSLSSEENKQEVIEAAHESATTPILINSKIVTKARKNSASHKRTSRLTQLAKKRRSASTRRKVKYRLS